MLHCDCKSSTGIQYWSHDVSSASALPSRLHLESGIADIAADVQPLLLLIPLALLVLLRQMNWRGRKEPLPRPDCHLTQQAGDHDNARQEPVPVRAI